jgi:hypothetical protein
MAGRKARCACGAVVVVPPAPTLVAAQPRPIPIEQQAVPVAAVALPAPPLKRARALKLGYVSARRKPRHEDVSILISPMRDTYVPLGLVITGFIAMVLWALLALDTTPSRAVVVLFASGVTTAIKTAVLVGLALVIAPHAGLSLGSFWSALLKLAAIVIFSDAMLMWVEEWMASIGALPSGGYRRGWGRVRWLELLLAAAVIGFLMSYLFDMDGEEVGWVAMPIAITSWFVGLVMKLLVLSVLYGGLAGAAAAQTAAGGGAGSGPGPPAATTAPVAGPVIPARLDVTPRDRTISALVAERSPFIKNVSQWDDQQMLRNRGQKRLMERLMESGVKRIFHDMQGTVGRGGKLYVELPLAAADRAACFEAYTGYCSDAAMDVDANEAKDNGQRYLVIELKR